MLQWKRVITIAQSFYEFPFQLRFPGLAARPTSEKDQLSGMWAFPALLPKVAQLGWLQGRLTAVLPLVCKVLEGVQKSKALPGMMSGSSK